MSIVDTTSLELGEPLPGWHDRYFRSETMSFAYYDVDEGASIHEHWHADEEVWHVIEGTLEVIIDGEKFGPVKEPRRWSHTEKTSEAQRETKIETLR